VNYDCDYVITISVDIRRPLGANQNSTYTHKIYDFDIWVNKWLECFLSIYIVDLHCRIHNDIFTRCEGKNQLPLIGFSQAFCKHCLPNRERARRSLVLVEIIHSRLNLRENRKLWALEKKIEIVRYFISIYFYYENLKRKKEAQNRIRF